MNQPKKAVTMLLMLLRNNWSSQIEQDFLEDTVFTVYKLQNTKHALNLN